MSEAERRAAMKAKRLELFQLRDEIRGLATNLQERRCELRRKERALHSTGLKMCRKCRREMGMDQFYNDRRYVDCKDPYCVECRGEMYRSRRAKVAA